MYVLGPDDGGWTRERRDREAATVAAELETMDATEAIAAVSPIRPEEWPGGSQEWTLVDLNAYLRGHPRAGGARPRHASGPRCLAQ